jgi:hypothetical protein
MGGKRQSDEGADSVTSSEAVTTATCNPLISNSAVGGSGSQSVLDSSTQGK